MGVFGTNVITPENLEYIKIQYLNEGGINKVNLPSIFLKVINSNIKENITLQEIKPYINYLQIRATLTGKSVIAVQDATNRSTIITVGDPIPTRTDGTVLFKLNGVDFTGARNLIGITNVSSITANKTANVSNCPFIVTFQVPVVGDGVDFNDEYQFGFDIDNVFVYALNDGFGNWTVYLTGDNATDNFTGTIDIIANAFIKVTANGQDVVLYSDTIYQNGIFISNGVPKYLRYEPAFFPEYLQSSVGGFDVTQKIAGVVQTAEYSVWVTKDINVLNVNIDEIVIDKKFVKIAVDLAVSAVVIGYNIYHMIRQTDTAGAFVDSSFQKIRGNTLYLITEDVSKLPTTLKLYRMGVEIQSVAITTQYQAMGVTVGNEDYDAISIGGSTPPVAGNVRNLVGNSAKITNMNYGGIDLDYVSGQNIPIAGGQGGNYTLPVGEPSGETLTVLIADDTVTQITITDNAGVHILPGGGPGFYQLILTINPMFPVLDIKVE